MYQCRQCSIDLTKDVKYPNRKFCRACYAKISNESSKRYLKTPVGIENARKRAIDRRSKPNFKEYLKSQSANRRKAGLKHYYSKIKPNFHNDILKKLTHYVRCRVRLALKYQGLTKQKQLIEYLGCTPEFLRLHLESLFQPGMTWEAHGKEGWHIDHIVPLSSAKTEEELYSLCHYTNLQPLWATDNLSKGSKIL